MGKKRRWFHRFQSRPVWAAGYGELFVICNIVPSGYRERRAAISIAPLHDEFTELLRFCAFFVHVKNAKVPSPYHLSPITYHLSPTPYHPSPTTCLAPKRSGECCNEHPLRERSDRMGEGPRAQRTGVWVFFRTSTYLTEIACAAVVFFS